MMGYVNLMYLFLLLMSCVLMIVEPAEVLMQPYAYGICSRFRDHIRMAEVLVERGHHLTVLINRDDRTAMEHIQGVTFLDFPYPTGGLKAGDYEVEKQLMDMSGFTLLRVIHLTNDMHFSVCDNIFSDSGIIRTLTTTKFDVFITDVVDPCSRILVSLLDLPTVGYSSHGPSPDPVFFPHIMSMTPVMFAPLPDDMTFGERLGNAIGFFISYFLFIPISGKAAQAFVDERQIELKIPLSNAFIDALILVGTDSILEYPRPFMPNVIQVGGWFTKPSKPLEGDIKKFIEQSKNKEFIYLSFGTIVSKSHTKQMKILAKLFALYPEYNFIWKYNGPPIEVTDNVMPLSWAPQNDLLGHPNLRLFITHCGSHSSNEVIYHGVPIVAVPLFTDQPSNAYKLVNRLHMGVQVDFHEMTAQVLYDAIQEVLTNDTYSQNARYVQSLRLDQQTTPLSRVIFYIEYVMRNHGMGLLTSKPLSRLSMLQLCSVDVLAVLGIVLFLVILVAFLLLRSIFRCFLRCCFGGRSKKLKKH